jgi:hypothetical protein
MDTNVSENIAQNVPPPSIPNRIIGFLEICT